MLVNTIIKWTLAPLRLLLTAIAPVSTCVIGITFAIPMWQSIFRLLMAAIWVPFIFYLGATSHLYQTVAVLRPLLISVSFPLLIVLDIFNALMPGFHRIDKYDRASMIDSWPFSSWDSIPDTLPKAIQCGFVRSVLAREGISSKGKQYSYGVDISIPYNVKASVNTTGNNRIEGHVERNPRFGKNQGTDLSFIDYVSGNHVPTNGHHKSLMPNKPLNTRTRISTCTLCGDMVRIDWERCPRCNEPLEGLLRLPVMWDQKASPTNGKVIQLSR